MSKLFVVDTENTNNYSFVNEYNLNSNDKVILFFSDKSKSITIDTFDCLLKCKALIKTERVFVGGKNALDFQIVAFVTEKVIRNIYNNIYIISNDNGFIYAIDYINKSYNGNVELKSTNEKNKCTKTDTSLKEISATALTSDMEDIEAISKRIIPTISDRKIIYIKRTIKECKDNKKFHKCLTTSFGENDGKKLYNELIKLHIKLQNKN